MTTHEMLTVSDLGLAGYEEALALQRSLADDGGKTVEPTKGAVQMELLDRSSTNGNGSATSRKCPDCNTPVVFQEGCLMCISCGWNKCE